MQRKGSEYFASGAQQVWHLFPETQTVTVYTAPTEAITYAPEADSDAGVILPGFRCRVSELFAVRGKPFSAGQS